MSQVVIEMDPHKRSATIEVMAGDETVLGGGRYGTDGAGYRAMLAEARRWPQRVWAAGDARGSAGISRAGNRHINRVLHIMAVVQLRNPTEGRACYGRKVAAGKTPTEAMRALKRRLSDIACRQMTPGARAWSTGPGGHMGAATGSSAAGSHPSTGTWEKSLPGPATHDPTPAPASPPIGSPPRSRHPHPAPARSRAQAHSA